MHAPSNPLSLIGPAILLVFAGCFFMLWYSDRDKRYVLWIAAAIVLFFLGSLSQITGLPPSVGANALSSGALYVGSAILMCTALIQRHNIGVPNRLFAILFFLVLGGIAYYFYMDRNLVARIYVLNFGVGVILTVTVFRIKNISAASVADRVLLWIIVAFTLQFFIRTVLTAEKLQNTAQGYGFSVFWSVLQLSLAIFGVALALSVLAVIVNDRIRKIDDERTTDSLSGILNRRGFEERFSRLTDQMTNAVGALLLIDIDHFKRINDRYGHLTGDAVIKDIAKLIHEMTAPLDGLACRLGGEEFAVLLTAVDEKEAVTAAENIRAGIEKNHTTSQSSTVASTVSIGICTYITVKSLDELLKHADEALYIAKRGGRNRVVMLT